MKKREVGGDARGAIAADGVVATAAHTRPSAGEPTRVETTHGERATAAVETARGSRAGASWDGEPHLPDAYRDIDYDPAVGVGGWSRSYAEPGPEHPEARRSRPLPSADNDVDLPGAHGYREQQHENPGVFGPPGEPPDLDEGLRAAVLARVSDVPGLDLHDLEVRVRRGEVTLRGVVDDVSTRDALARAAAEVTGVVRVDNDLRIARALDIFPRRSGAHH